MSDIPTRLASALADRYRLERILGQGGMATVYLAEDLKHHRKVAIKVLKPELATTIGPERFVREIEIAARLSHPHILPLYDSGKAGEFLYFVMPFVDGESLRQRLDREESIPLGDAVRLTDDVATALSYAHQLGIVHRDIKPENIMLTGGRAVVADFGIARALEVAGGEKLTQTGLAIGTPTYMSPEQAMGLDDVDARTDVYALGCVVYEMIGGRPPFDGTTPQALLAKHAAQTVPGLRASRPEVPPDIERVVERALAKDPAERWQTPGAFAAALTLRPAVASERNRTRRTAAAVVAVVILAAVAGWWLIGTGSEPAIQDRSIAVLPFETLGQLENTAFTDGVHSDLLTRLSGVSGLSVTSRTSVMRYRRPDMTTPTIARELGVAWVLQGEVQESADEVQVSARLVNARTDQQVWAQSYRRELTATNLFEIQSEITSQIARALETQLSPSERQRMALVPTQNLDAYRRYVQGRGLLDQRTEDGMRQAVEYFRQAIALDSSYALAWAGLADAFWLLEDYGYAEYGSLLPRAGDAAQRALDLGPDLAEAHASLGMIHYARREGPAAVRQLQLAVGLRTSYAEAHNWLSWVNLLVGRPQEALASAKRAVELNPLSPEAVSNLSLSYLVNGKEQLALQEARHTQEILPDYATGHFYEAVSLYHLGQPADAQSIVRDLEVPWTESGPVAVLALARVATGDSASARELLGRLSEVGQPFSVGLVHAALGEEQAALLAFQEVGRWSSWPTIATRYLFPGVLGPLRRDPRYRQLLDEVDRSWGLGDSG